MGFSNLYQFYHFSARCQQPQRHWRKELPLRGCSRIDKKQALQYNTFSTAVACAAVRKERPSIQHQAITILRYISLLQRNTRRYFDLTLEQDQIGSGQQFFLLRIFENDGISMQDLARLGSFDKGTVTRAVQKLVIEGYVRTEADPQDKRVRHIYLTERARPLIDHVYQIRDYWTEALARGLREEEKQPLFGARLRDMAERSSAPCWKR